MRKLPKMYKTEEFQAMFAESGINVRAWWYNLRKWREEGKLRPNEHYITETTPTGSRAYKYMRRPVLTLIVQDFPKSHFSRTILLYYKDEIDQALSKSVTPQSTGQSAPAEQSAPSDKA